MPLLEKAQEILQSDHLIGLADSGYYSGEQLKQADEKGIEIYVPIPKKNGSTEKGGRFTRDHFTYDAESDCYQCPQGGRDCERIQNRAHSLVGGNQKSCQLFRF